jgi:hypothetical protein
MWQKTMFIESEDQLQFALSINLLGLILALVSLKSRFLQKHYQPFLKGFVFISLFFTLIIAWNILFRWYSNGFDFKGNIFRGIFYGFRAPFYGRLKPQISFSDYYPILISSAVFIIAIFTINWRKENKWTRFILMALGLLLFFSFSWHNSIHQTLLATNCHFKTFSEGLVSFPYWSTFLSSYTEEMKNLGAHNNHYPPGVILFLKINKAYLPYLVKTLVIVSPIISLFPLTGILKHFSFSNKQINIYSAFYISSIALLFFPGKSMAPLHILFASTFIYSFLKSLDSKSLIYGLMAGLTLALYAFFSFSFLVFGLFFAVFIVLLMLYKKLSIHQVIIPSLSILFTFLIIYGLLFLLSNFNLYTCFQTAIHNESVQMKSSGREGILRYFIISSGNLIAYLGIIGPIIIGIYAERMYSGVLKINTPFTIFIKAVLISILLFSFSGQFHLEVERIWIFLSPFALFGVLLYKPIKDEHQYPIRIALTLSIVMSVVTVILLGTCS